MTKFKFSHFFQPKKWQSPNFQAISELFHSEFRTLFGIFCYGYLRYLCLFVFIVVSTLVFMLFVFVCIYSPHCVVYLLCLSSSCVHYICMLPVSLDCPYFIAPSVFSNVYFNREMLHLVTMLVLYNLSLYLLHKS